MARPPTAPPPATPDDIEQQFYEALQRGQIEPLMSTWADDDEICCVHPGGSRSVGASAIRASFEAVFANGGVPVQPESIRRLEGSSCAMSEMLGLIALGANTRAKPSNKMPFRPSKGN